MILNIFSSKVFYAMLTFMWLTIFSAWIAKFLDLETTCGFVYVQYWYLGYPMGTCPPVDYPGTELSSNGVLWKHFQYMSWGCVCLRNLSLKSPTLYF